MIRPKELEGGDRGEKNTVSETQKHNKLFNRLRDDQIKVVVLLCTVSFLSLFSCLFFFSFWRGKNISLASLPMQGFPLTALKTRSQLCFCELPPGQIQPNMGDNRSFDHALWQRCLKLKDREIIHYVYF